jgi:hypothetical protein
MYELVEFDVESYLELEALAMNNSESIRYEL